MNQNRISTAHLSDDFIRQELQIAFDQVDRGEVSDLDMNTLLAEAHRRNNANYSDSAEPQNEQEQ